MCGRAGLVVLVIAFLGALAAVATVRSWTTAVAAGDYTTVETARARIEVDDPTCDPRWEKELAACMARVPAFSSLDPLRLEQASRALLALPFVAEVGEPRVRWPDGFEVPVRLRKPVACIRVREVYLNVDADGFVLPGEHPAPLWRSNGFLPVLGPNDGTLDRIAPGERLVDEHRRDALAVALSMRKHLTARDFETLGPPLIDARNGRRASVEEPGVVIRLPDSRAIFFGRPPNTGEPGELPAQLKWSAVSRASERLSTSEEQRDWSVLDVRWDVPAIQWRAAVVPLAED
ncbi:MAG: cell division protein FtsQ/DivIB [Planctomycetota bacterium]